MTTGYTVYIQDGDITTGKDFLKLCLRNFGIGIDMRDEPLSKSVPTYFEPDPYYKKYYDKAVEDRDNFKKMSFEQVKQQLIEKQKKDVESIKESIDKYIAEDKKYIKVRKEIENWNPPTSEHEDLKKFALDQIDRSLNTDLIKYCNEKLNLKLDISDINDEVVYTHINTMNEIYEQNVERTYKNWQREIKKTADKNMWMKQFLDSVDNISVQEREKHNEDEYKLEEKEEEEPDVLQVDGYMDGVTLPNLYTATYILSDSYIDFVNGEINNMEWKDKSDQLIMRVRLRDESMNENIYISIKASDVCKFYDNYNLDFNKLHANQIFADLCHDKHYFNDRIDDMVETYGELPSSLEENEYDER